MSHRARPSQDRRDTTIPVLRGAGCPHPEKLAFATKARAKLSVKRMTRVSGRETLRPYRCECGAFHLGHTPGSRKNRPRPALVDPLEAT